MSDEELKHAGFELKIPAPIHIKALGAGGDHGWTYKSDEMCVYGWIINAATRDVVWEMTVDKDAVLATYQDPRGGPPELLVAEGAQVLHVRFK